MELKNVGKNPTIFKHIFSLRQFNPASPPFSKSWRLASLPQYIVPRLSCCARSSAIDGIYIFVLKRVPSLPISERKTCGRSPRRSHLEWKGW